MTSKTRRNLQAFAVWLVLMTGMFFMHGFPDVWWFLGCAWVCLIIGGVLVVIWENLTQKQESSEQDKKWFDSHEAFEQGMAHYQKKDFQNALACFDKAIECGYKENIYHFRGDCHLECGSHAQAIRDYNTAISLQPDDCNLFFSRSCAKSAAGDIDGEIEDLTAAVRLSKIDNEMNKEYRSVAQKMGWPDGHTSLYESHLLMAQLTKGRVSNNSIETTPE